MEKQTTNQQTNIFNDPHATYGVFFKAGTNAPYEVVCARLYAGHYTITPSYRDAESVCDQLNGHEYVCAVRDGNKVLFDVSKPSRIRFTTEHNPTQFIASLREQAVENMGCERIFEKVECTSLPAGTYWVSLCDEDEVEKTSAAFARAGIVGECDGNDIEFTLFLPNMPVTIYTSIGNVPRVQRDLEARAIKINNSIGKKLKEMPIVKKLQELPITQKILNIRNKKQTSNNQNDELEQTEDDSFNF